MKIKDIDLGPRPVFLAPMEDVTDPAFRLMCKHFGADMVYTEFVSADALIRSVGKTQQKLNICDEERKAGSVTSSIGARNTGRGPRSISLIFII